MTKQEMEKRISKLEIRVQELNKIIDDMNLALEGVYFRGK